MMVGIRLTNLGGYHEYFGENVDMEAMVYLMLVGSHHPIKNDWVTKSVKEINQLTILNSI